MVPKHPPPHEHPRQIVHTKTNEVWKVRNPQQESLLHVLHPLEGPIPLPLHYCIDDKNKRFCFPPVVTRNHAKLHGMKNLEPSNFPKIDSHIVKRCLETFPQPKSGMFQVLGWTSLNCLQVVKPACLDDTKVVPNTIILFHNMNILPHLQS